MQRFDKTTATLGRLWPSRLMVATSVQNQWDINGATVVLLKHREADKGLR